MTTSKLRFSVRTSLGTTIEVVHLQGELLDTTTCVSFQNFKPDTQWCENFHE